MSAKQEPVSARGRLERHRAGFAYNAVCLVRDGHARQKEDYATLVKDLSSSILRNGLGQAVAFLMSKAEGKETSAHGLLLDQLAAWLIDKDNGRCILQDPGISTPATERLMCALLCDQGEKKTTRAQWRRAEQEALELAIWLKRFSEALIPKRTVLENTTDDEGSEKATAEARADQ